MTAFTDTKQIVFNRDTRDFSAFFDGQLIGCFDTRPEAQIALDDHSLRLIEDGLVDLPLTLLDTPISQYTCLGCGGALPAGRGGHCDACVEWGDGVVPDGTPSDDYDDVPAGPGEPTYHALVNWNS